jgi:hypothetical protein
MRSVSIEPEALIGHTLMGVSSSWHEFEGRRCAQPVHVWLSFDGLGTLRLHTLNGLVIGSGDVYEPYDMGEHGRMLVEESSPTSLVDRVGDHVETVSRLYQAPPGATVGMVLHFQGGSVGMADLGDDLVVATWPAAIRPRQNVSVESAD